MATVDHGGGRRLRSVDWFGEPGRMGAIYRSWVRGYTPEVFDGRPVIGIANSWSELTPCNTHLRRVADAVKQGVWQAGGFPLAPAATSHHATTTDRPTRQRHRPPGWGVGRHRQLLAGTAGTAVMALGSRRDAATAPAMDSRTKLHRSTGS